MKIDAALVSKVAALASLDLTDAERSAMAEQLTRIVDHFEALREIPDELLGGDETPRAMPLREDAVDAARRLSRAIELPLPVDRQAVVNDGTVEQGVRRLLAAISRAAGGAPPA